MGPRSREAVESVGRGQEVERVQLAEPQELAIILVDQVEVMDQAEAQDQIAARVPWAVVVVLMAQTARVAPVV